MCGVEKAAALTNTAGLRYSAPLTDSTVLRDTSVPEQPRTVCDICLEAWFDADNSRVSIQLICVNENSAHEYVHLRVFPSTV